MSALGWTFDDACLPSGFRAKPVGGVTLIVADGPELSPRGRLRRQLALAATLDAFLPMAPGCDPDVGNVTAWTETHRGAIADRLCVTRGAVQVSVQAVPLSISASPGDAGSWLRTRADARAARRAWQEDARGLLGREIAPLSPRAMSFRPTRSGLTADILIARARTDAVLARLGRALRGARPTLTCAIVGPLPVFAFTDTLVAAA